MTPGIQAGYCLFSFFQQTLVMKFSLCHVLIFSRQHQFSSAPVVSLTSSPETLFSSSKGCERIFIYYLRSFAALRLTNCRTQKMPKIEPTQFLVTNSSKFKIALATTTNAAVSGLLCSLFTPIISQVLSLSALNFCKEVPYNFSNAPSFAGVIGFDKASLYPSAICFCTLFFPANFFIRKANCLDTSM